MSDEQLASRLRTWAGEDRNKVRAADMAVTMVYNEIKRLQAVVAEMKTKNRHLADLLANVVCPYCGDRACMDCCGRFEHDECEDDCPVCCADQPKLTVTGYPLDAWRARRSWLLGSDKP